jgi:hypothetical protein
MQQQSADARTELLRLWKLATLAIGIGPLGVGSFFGTLSHLVLDSLMHHDIHRRCLFQIATRQLIWLDPKAESGTLRVVT